MPTIKPHLRACLSCLSRRAFAEAKRAAFKIKCLGHHPLNRYAPHAEHIGFVAYAAAEVGHATWLLYGVSMWLLATGLWVLLVNLED